MTSRASQQFGHTLARLSLDGSDGNSQFDVERRIFVGGGKNTLPEALGIGQPGLRQHYGESVVAAAGDEIARADVVVDDPGHGLQQRLDHGVAARLADALVMVDGHDRQRERPFVASPHGQQHAKDVLQLLPVANAGQAVGAEIDHVDEILHFLANRAAGGHDALGQFGGGQRAVQRRDDLVEFLRPDQVLLQHLRHPHRQLQRALQRQYKIACGQDAAELAVVDHRQARDVLVSKKVMASVTGVSEVQVMAG